MNSVLWQYEKFGRKMHFFGVLISVLLGLLLGYVLSASTILPAFSIAALGSKPESGYVAFIYRQRALFPPYINSLGLIVLCYCCLRCVNLVCQYRFLSRIRKEMATQLRNVPTTPSSTFLFDDRSFLSDLKNYHKSIKLGMMQKRMRRYGLPYHRLSLILGSFAEYSGESLATLNDHASSFDYYQLQRSYAFVKFIIKLIIFLGLLAVILGLFLTGYPVISGDVDVSFFTSHLLENFFIVFYCFGLGLSLFFLLFVLKYFEERLLVNIDNVMLVEIIEKIPFKHSDTILILQTFLQTFRRLEKDLREDLSKIQKRLD